MTSGVRVGVAVAALLGGLLAAGAAVAQARTGSAQVEAGHALYNGRCASCHAADLGGHEGPQLAGAGFQQQWGAKTPAQLADDIKGKMPPGQPNLSDQDSFDLTAFILSANGVPAVVTATGTKLFAVLLLPSCP